MRDSAGAVQSWMTGPNVRRVIQAYLLGEHLKNEGVIRVLGFWMVFGLMLPYFGRSFSLFGIHLRIVSFFMMATIYVAAWPGFPIRKARNDLGVLLMIFLVLAVVYAAPVQFRAVGVPQYEQPFYDGKLAVIIQISCPYLLAAYLVSPYRENGGFVSGMWLGFLCCGVIGLGVMFAYRVHFIGQTHVEAHRFQSLMIFSTISMSLIFSFALLAVLGDRMRRPAGISVLLGLGVIFFICVIILNQRTHLVLLPLLAAARLIGARSKTAFAVSAAFAVVFTALVVCFSYQVLTPQMRMYWHEAMLDPVFATRLDIWPKAVSEALKSPWGHGLGEYALSHAEKYPHNIVIEAFYELGVAGAVCIGAICLMALQQVSNLFRFRNATLVRQKAWFMSGIVLFMLCHELKAGTIAYIYLFPCLIFLAPGRCFFTVFNPRPARDTL